MVLNSVLPRRLLVRGSWLPISGLSYPAKNTKPALTVSPAWALHLPEFCTARIVSLQDYSLPPENRRDARISQWARCERCPASPSKAASGPDCRHPSSRRSRFSRTDGVTRAMCRSCSLCRIRARWRSHEFAADARPPARFAPARPVRPYPPIL